MTSEIHVSVDTSKPLYFGFILIDPKSDKDPQVGVVIEETYWQMFNHVEESRIMKCIRTATDPGEALIYAMGFLQAYRESCLEAPPGCGPPLGSLEPWEGKGTDPDGPMA